MKNWAIDKEMRELTRKFAIRTLIGVGMAVLLVGLALEGHYYFQIW